MPLAQKPEQAPQDNDGCWIGFMLVMAIVLVGIARCVGHEPAPSVEDRISERAGR